MEIARITQIPSAPMLAEDILPSGADVFFRTVDDRDVLFTVNVFLISISFCSNSASVMLFEFVGQTQEHSDVASVV